MTATVLARHVLRSRRTMTILTALGVAFLGLVTALLYPDFEEALQDFEVPSGAEGLFGEGLDPSSPEGFLQSQFFGFVPVVVAAVGITIGSYAIAGEERDGTLELLLAQPVQRQHLVLGAAVAVTVIVVITTLVGFPAVWIGCVLVDVDISTARLWWATVAMVPTALVFSLLALWFSAFMPTRAAAAMGASVLLAVTYIIYVIGGVNDLFEVLRRLSPFYWGDTAPPLIGNNEYVQWLLLVAVSFVFVPLAMWSLERRDLRTGGSDWTMTGFLLAPWRRLRPERG